MIKLIPYSKDIKKKKTHYLQRYKKSGECATALDVYLHTCICREIRALVWAGM